VDTIGEAERFYWSNKLGNRMKLNSTICHVGYTMSGDDMERVVQVSDWCMENGINYPDSSVFLDLNKGKDFLAMDATYDMVILHFICRFDKFQSERAWKGLILPTLKVSPLASWSNWRKRLVGTNADHIFLFGGMGEVSGPFVATLDGYKGERLWEDDGRMTRECWLFRKEKV
jgi:hypothetical protein